MELTVHSFSDSLNNSQARTKRVADSLAAGTDVSIRFSSTDANRSLGFSLSVQRKGTPSRVITIAWYACG